MEPGWALGVCKKTRIPKKSEQLNNGKNYDEKKNNENNENNEEHHRLEDVCNYP